jgi:hypothetical protein
VSYLAGRLTVTSDASAERVAIRTRSALHLAGSALYDACLTSPPYATRVDYPRAMLAELSVLGLAPNQVDALRRATTGTPTVRGAVPKIKLRLPRTATAVIEHVASHGSHGSSSYYAPWITNYFVDLQASLVRIDNAVTKQGRIGLVVQDSFYKAVHLDLQTVVEEAMADVGRRLVCRDDYAVRHLMARMNPAARRHLETRTNYESLLVFT